MAVTRNADAVAPVRSAGRPSIWFSRHKRTAIESLEKLARQPFSSLMIVLVIAVTLSLPAAVNVLVKNARSISNDWESALDFSVYLQEDVSVSEAEGLTQLIGQRADVDTVQLVTATDALAQFKEMSGFGAALDQLSDNPLPHTLIVRPGDSNTTLSLSLMQEEIANLPEANFVQVDTEWVQRFHAILDIVRHAIAIGSALLAAAIIVIVGNTIRLDIESRRDEIEVTKLIGASNAFVRRPFLWTGFWYGLLGGGFALLLVQYGLYLLRAPAMRLAGLYQGNITLVTMSLAESGAVIGIAIALGLIGSWFTAARHMRRIEPK